MLRYVRVVPDSYGAITGSGIYAQEANVPCEALIEMTRLVKPGKLTLADLPKSFDLSL